ncbi:MAG TPA: hypothetical protein VLA80_04445 [Actinomycetota bacterium]|nr:hypothetical protein [Actinomycetota bacterium]
MTRRPRATGMLLALVVLPALLGAGGAGRTGAAASGSLLAGPAAGPEQGLVRDRPGRPLVMPGGTRDQRGLPPAAMPGVLALAVAAAWTVVAVVVRRAARPAGRHAAASGARAPPSLRPSAS